MNEVLKVYQAQLVTDGPVFIGSGKEIGKKEYVFFSKKKKIEVMSQSKLALLLNKKGLTDHYLQFMLGRSRDDLGIWMKKNSILESEYRNCKKYTLDCGDTELETHSKLSIMEFVKDGYGLPYIPGSSIKGMLRTILLSYDIVNNQKKYAKYKDSITEEKKGKIFRNTYLKKEASGIENNYFRTINRIDTRKDDAVNDIMSGIIISDSAPLSLEDLVLCQRTELHINGEEKKLNVLRESLRPGTVIPFQITIDTSICKLTEKDIFAAIESFGKVYYDCFLRKYSVFDMPSKNSVWLGGGVGFLSKTEVYPLFGEKQGIDTTVKIFGNTNVPREHKHYKDKDLNVSPHICKISYYQGKRYQMGLCHLKLEMI